MAIVDERDGIHDWPGLAESPKGRKKRRLLKDLKRANLNRKNLRGHGILYRVPFFLSDVLFFPDLIMEMEP